MDKEIQILSIAIPFLLNILFLTKIVSSFVDVKSIDIIIINIFALFTLLYLFMHLKSLKYTNKLLFWVFAFNSISIFTSIFQISTDQMYITIINTYSKITYWSNFLILGLIIGSLSSKPLVINQMKKYIILYSFISFAIFLVFIYNGVDNYLNHVYYLVLMLPYFSFIKNKHLRFTMFLVTGILVLLSYKATAIFGYIIYMILYTYFDSKINRDTANNRLGKLLLILVIVLIILPIVYLIQVSLSLNILNKLNIAYLFETGGSGRIDIYLDVINMQKNSTIIQWIIGRGFDGVFRYTRWNISAHNDFLEILFDYGIFALFSYLITIFIITKYGFTLLKNKKTSAVPLLSSVGLVIFMSMTTHLIHYQSYYASITLFWGFQIGFSTHIDKLIFAHKKEGKIYHENRHSHISQHL